MKFLKEKSIRIQAKVVKVKGILIRIYLFNKLNQPDHGDSPVVYLWITGESLQISSVGLDEVKEVFMFNYITRFKGSPSAFTGMFAGGLPPVSRDFEISICSPTIYTNNSGTFFMILL